MATATAGRSDEVNRCREEPTGFGHAEVQSSSGAGGARPVSGRLRREPTRQGS